MPKTTPINEELEAKILEIFYQWELKEGVDLGPSLDREEALDHLLQLIEEQSTKARIVENERYLEMLKTGNWRSFATEVTDRLRQLKQPSGGGE